MVQKFHKYVINLITVFTLFNFVNCYSTIDYLDTTFGSDANGKVIKQIGEFAQVNGVAVNSSGKVIAVGSAVISGVQNLVVAQFNSNGSIDTSFATSGIFSTNFSSNFAYANAVAIDSSGKILVAGTDGSNGLVVIRLTTAGALDSTFGTGGIATLTIGDAAPGKAITIDGNGKILVAGTAVVSGSPNLYVARFTSTGGVDSTFNTTGYNAVSGSFGYTGNAIAIDQNAKILVGGYAQESNGTDFLLVRFNSTDGAVDSSFGTSGIVTTEISANSNDIVQALAIDSSNKIIAAGHVLDSNNGSFVVTRYSNAGVLDDTFGENSDGIVVQSIGVSALGNAALIDQGGNIVVGGTSDDNFAAARFDSNGSLDTTFGTGGILTSEVGNFASGSTALAMQSSDGRVIAGGFAVTNESSGDSSFALVRYNKNNVDFVNITSIADNSTINTKIPTVSGTSNGTTSPQATVQVLVNGVALTTVNTDGSGNWNAGRTNVLPNGANTIQANLIINSQIVVSHVTKFTVTDNLSEDALFAYNSSSQTANADSSFASLPFNSILLGTSVTAGTWTYLNNVFTCKKSGRYLIEYVGYAGTTSNGTLTAAINVATAIFINSTEYIGSESNVNVDLTNGFVTTISKSFIKDLNANDTVSLNFAIDRTGGTGTVTGGLLANSGAIGTQHAYSIAITRIG